MGFFLKKKKKREEKKEVWLMVKVVLRNEFAFNMIYLNVFPMRAFVVPFLVSPRNGLKESVSKPETLILRNLFHIGMHKITTLATH